MRVSVPHNTTKEAAKKKLQALADQLLREHGHRIEDVDQQWQGDQLLVSMKARGFNVKGMVEVTDSDVIVDGKLPLIAKPFESKIKSTIEKEGQKIFAA
jgi:Putative polyhydroxyalkanoic acid system protein (PHA_gran_rgn).